MSTSCPCIFLDWDSALFAKRVARTREDWLTRDSLDMVVSWCEVNRIDCLYLLCKVSDLLTAGLAQDNGFRLVDIRCEFENLAPHEACRARDERVRFSTSADFEELKAIARVSFRDSRFYADGNFERQDCDRLYEIWIEKSCRGWADVVLVADDDEGRNAGFITCHLDPEGRGRIGLLAVAPSRRGQGVGQRLIRAAKAWFVGQGMKSVRVVTQARNLQAIRTYEKESFRLAGTHLWFHKWFTRIPIAEFNTQ